MIKKFRRSKMENTSEMSEINRQLRMILSKLASGEIPSEEYTETDLKLFCQSLVKGQAGPIGRLKGGSWCLSPTADNMPGDARVEFVHLPTYLAISILTIFATHYPKLAKEITGLDKTLASGMYFVGLTKLRGHGYEADDDMFEAVEILGKGNVPRYLKRNPDSCPELLSVLRAVKADAETKLEKRMTRGSWGEDHSKGYHSIARILKDL